ncbi:MAG: DUF2288 family protein [Verrucomicrobiaceae bacterium]|nr:MAG: DUF2288 family protein [Verrucomicrobiaceae bacterium]
MSGPDDDKLRYQMLGDDGLTEEERLKKYTGPVSYDYLLGPLRNGVLVVVHEALDLAEVGMAFIRDDRKRVQAWLDEELLVKADEETFEKREGPEAYTAVVVSPFVLVR